MNDVLDDRLREMMRTAVGAPMAPPPEDVLMATISASGISTGAVSTHRRARMLGMAAAMLGVAAVGAVTWWAASPPRQQAPASPTDAGLYYLPAEVPAGWTIVDGYVDHDAGLIWSSDAAALRRTDGSDVAVVVVPDAADSTAGAAGTWDASERRLSWYDGSRSYVLYVRSGDEASARSAAASIRPPASRVTDVVDVAAGSGWEKVDEQRSRQATLTTDQLVLGDDTGRTITVIRQHQPEDLTTTWLTVTPLTEPEVRPVDASAGLTAWIMVRGSDTLIAAASDPSASGVARALVGNLVPRTAAEWAAAQPDTGERVGAATTVAQTELLDHRVSVHRSLPWQGICVERSDGAQGCAYTPVGQDGSVDVDSIPAAVPLSDGSWVAVASMPPDATMCDTTEMNASQVAVDDQSPVRLALVVPRDLARAVACDLRDSANRTFLVQPPPG